MKQASISLNLVLKCRKNEYNTTKHIDEARKNYKNSFKNMI